MTRKGGITIPDPVAERVVLLDPAGRSCGTALKREVHSTRTPLHLAFSCYLFDADGRVLMTRRALSKRTWPGVWSNSCCGHPSPGERMEEAVVRRVDQELGLAVEDLQLRLPDFRYRATDSNGVVENELCPVYSGRAVGLLTPDPTEVCDWVWARFDEVERVAAGSPWALSPWATEQIMQLRRRR